jgi:hypothetical protein
VCGLVFLVELFSKSKLVSTIVCKKGGLQALISVTLWGSLPPLLLNILMRSSLARLRKKHILGFAVVDKHYV